MEVFRHLEELPADYGPTVVSVGNFDGVHRGHQAVLGSVVRSARELRARSLVTTFEPHPMRILRPDQAPKLITPTPVKLDLLSRTGVDAVLPRSLAHAAPAIRAGDPDARRACA